MKTEYSWPLTQALFTLEKIGIGPGYKTDYFLKRNNLQHVLVEIGRDTQGVLSSISATKVLNFVLIIIISIMQMMEVWIFSHFTK